MNLEASVQAIVLPQLSQAKSSQVWDYNTILEQLTRVYDNPNKRQEAKDKLYRLKQGTYSLLIYVTKFERIHYEASSET